MISERFEALVDAVLAIILTIIVLELPLPSDITWNAVWQVRIELFAYLVSFFIVFNYWNSHQEIFSIANNIDSKVIWTNGLLLFVLSFLPYLTSFLSNNFFSVFAQTLYALEFIALDIIFYIIIYELKGLNKNNKEIEEFNALNEEIMMLIILAVGFIIGYTVYPPAIIVSCLVSRILWILNSHVTKTIGF